jgi:hypothetical protein
MAGELPISPRVIQLLQDLREEWTSLDERIRAYDDELAALTRENGRLDNWRPSRASA